MRTVGTSATLPGGSGTGPAEGAFHFPAEGGFLGARAWEQGRLRGRLYAPLSRALSEAVPRWLAGGAARDGVALHPPHVFRVDGLVVKRFPAPTVFGWLRTPRAARSAARHYWCLPLVSPRPLIAAWQGLAGPSLLVREFVPGGLLSELFGREARADAALPAFLAQLARQGVLHGDLHPRNLLWTGASWCVLDVDGVRHGLHVRGRGWEKQWARLALYLGDEERVSELFQRTQAELAAQGGGNASAHRRIRWARVSARARAMQRQRAHGLSVQDARAQP